MARDKNPNDKDLMKIVEIFFTNHYPRNHQRYTYIEFADSKQEAIEFYKIKLLTLKDMGASFMSQVMNMSDEQIKYLIENDSIMAFILADGELKEDITPTTLTVDVTLSNEQILKLLKDKRKNIDYGKGIFTSSNEKEFGSKLADSLYTLDCRKFYLTYKFIQQELQKYHGYNIKTDTLKKYYDEALQEYNNITIE